MNPRKFFGLGALLGLLFAGIWLVSGSPRLGSETSMRQDAVRQLAASAGVTAAGTGAFYAVAQEAVAPVMVNMSDVPAGIPDPNNMYERWLAGELDLANESHLTNAELASLRQLAMSLPADTDIDVLNEAIAGGTNLELDASFASLDFNTGGNGQVPPDPEIAAGHNYIISVVNTSFEIYDKQGNVVTPSTSFSSFLAGADCSGVLFDPNVVYDQENNRYVMGIDAGGARYCLAVSDGEDVTGNWAVYSFSAGNGSSLFFDYPHLGVGQDALFMGGNIYDLNSPGQPFVEIRMWAFDKGAMYTGQTANFTTFGITGGEFTPYPLTLNGWHGEWPSTHYFATVPGDGDTLTIHEWPNPLTGGAPSILTQIDVSTETGVASGIPVASPQNGGGDIKANDWRSRDFEYRNGSAWWTDSISCNPGSGTVNCVRWVEIDMTSVPPTFVQGGVAAGNGEYRIFPALAVNACGDMAVGYSKTTASIFPSAYVAGRQVGDAAGTLQDELLLKAGEVTYTAFDPEPRSFGDYSGMAIDPNGYDFWYVGEYSKDLIGAARWGVYIGSFSFPGCQIAVESNMLYLPIISTP